MVAVAELPQLSAAVIKGHRLVNSKFPPVNLFDDVASAEEFDVAYAMQSLVNPRLQAEVGNLSLIRREEIPFGIPGCSYATAPFTHVNPLGSRFSDGSFGILYLADTAETAILEVKHHQQLYWRKVPALNFDVFVFRELVATFNTDGLHDLSGEPLTASLYSPNDYAVSRQLGSALIKTESKGVQYNSVRKPGSLCWGLFTPASVERVKQSGHYEMLWTGPSTEVQIRKITAA
ncbi:MAG: hypothetical protein ACJAWI_000364 [Marinomonas primoryensis]